MGYDIENGATLLISSNFRKKEEEIKNLRERKVKFSKITRVD